VGGTRGSNSCSCRSITIGASGRLLAWHSGHRHTSSTVPPLLDTAADAGLGPGSGALAVCNLNVTQAGGTLLVNTAGSGSGGASQGSIGTSTDNQMVTTGAAGDTHRDRTMWPLSHYMPWSTLMCFALLMRPGQHQAAPFRAGTDTSVLTASSAALSYRVCSDDHGDGRQRCKRNPRHSPEEELSCCSHASSTTLKLF